jgi:hypothetical protein
MGFELPPHTISFEGNPRRAGFEFEFAGLGLEKAVEVVAATVNGAPCHKSRFVRCVDSGDLGTFAVILDMSFLKSGRYKEYLSWLGIEDPPDVDEAEEIMEEMARTLMPYEVVTPPLPFAQLQLVDELREALRRAGAEGTRKGLLYAFGMHINPEAWSLEVSELVDLMRAYMLLMRWIAEESEVVISRKITHFIDPFPEEYVRLVLAPGYEPDMTGFIGDYLQNNPTRNRSLDMLPLFAFIDPELVARFPVEHHQVKPRPAFHYRLPDSRMDEPRWQVAQAWNYWVTVERLAADKSRLSAMCRDYLDQAPFPLNILDDSWSERVRKWLAR